MDEIILQQRDAAKPLDGKSFVLSVAGIILRLAIAQVVVNLIIRMTGMGLLNILFYVYAVWLLVAFMTRTVAAYVYTLKHGVLMIEKKLGDSTNTLIEIPLSRVVSLRPAYMAERFAISYRQVTVIDPAAKPTGRTRAAFAASLFSARLARLLAGKRAQEQIGHVIVFVEEGQRRACVFRPNEAMCKALREQLGEAYGFDERMTQAKAHTLYARALERAFPALYRYVDPLIAPERVEWAKDEMTSRKESRKKGRPAAKKDAPQTEEKEAEAPRRRRTKQE